MKTANARLNITIDPEVLEVLDAECKKLGIYRSSYISMAILQKVKSDAAIGMLPELMKRTTELLQGLTSDEALDALKSSELKQLVDTVSDAADEAADAVGQTSFSNL